MQEDFEGPDVSWKVVQADLTYRIESHRRLTGAGRDGRSAEQIRVSGVGGTAIYIAHDVQPARVLDELSPRVWLKADRAGPRIHARVVLPHSSDSRTGKRKHAYIAGDAYKQPGSWQQLSIQDAPRELARQIRALRQAGHVIDSQDAYIDQIVLNAYGGHGSTTLVVDDLSIEGLVHWEQAAGVEQASLEEPARGMGEAQLSGTMLLVDGRPFFPRCIEHRGEPLETLARLGFNVVQLASSPSPEMLNEARRLGMWLICPPPTSGEIGPDYDCVLAWYLGDHLAKRELEETARRAKMLNQADLTRSRPLMCNADDQLRDYSRHVNILLTRRRPLSSSLELSDYGAWIQNSPRLAQPGMPWWSTIQTEPAAQLREQIAAISPEAAANASLDCEAIRLMVHTAIAAGMRGLVFESSSRLDAYDAPTRSRAAVLELINLELQLLEAWAAAGTPSVPATSSNPEITGAVLQTDKARLILPIRTGAGAQYVPIHTPGEITFLAPGVPQADEVYELSAGGVQPLRQKRREAGGTLMTLDNFGLTSMIVTTSDPSVVGQLYKRRSSFSRRAAELERELTTHSLAELQHVQSKLPGALPADALSRIATAQASLQRAESLTSAGSEHDAMAAVNLAATETRSLRRSLWQHVALSLGSPVASPMAACFATLPEHWMFSEQVKSSQLGPNRVQGGDFENLDLLLGAGWRHFELVQPQVLTAVELSADMPHGGRTSLRLHVSPTDEKNPPSLLETPPLWVTSAPVDVQSGELICIRGRVRIAKPITASVDGLMIVDSLGGEALAQRLGETGGWQEFVLYRSARHSGPMTVTFALTGIGEAWIDDLGVHPVQRNAAGAMPQANGRSFLETQRR